MSALPYALSREDTAIYLGISYRQVSRFLVSGDLIPAPRLGRKVRILSSSILRLEQEGPGWNRPAKKKAPKRNLGASEADLIRALPL